MPPAEIGPSQDCTGFGTFCSLAPVGMKKIVLLPSDYKIMFFKLSADIKFMPINLDLFPEFGDFVPPIRQV